MFAVLALLLPLAPLPWLLDVFALGGQVKIVKDGGLALLSVMGFLLVLFLASEQVIPDIERRSAYFFLTRNPSRFGFLTGKFLGVVASLAFFQLSFSAWILLLLRIHDGAWFWEILSGAVAVFLKYVVFSATLLFFATFGTRIVLLSLGILVFALGHGVGFLRDGFESVGSPVLSFLFESAAFFLPDFTVFEFRLAVVHEVSIQAAAFAWIGIYALCVSLFFLVLGGFVLERRDL